MTEMVEVIEGDQRVGYLPLSECARLGLTPRLVERTQPWIEDPNILYHAEMAYEMGLLKGDLNPVRRILLQSVLYRQHKREAERDEATFEQMLLVHKTEVWQKLQEQKKAEELTKELEGGDIEWHAPSTQEELSAFMAEFASAEDGDEDEVFFDDVPFGSVDSVLSKDEWRELGD